MSNNKNQNNNPKKTVPPITIINKTTHNSASQSNVSDTSPNGEWIVKSTNKRNFSTSSTSESQNSPKTPTQPIKKKLFATRNRFEVFTQQDNNDDIQHATNTTNNLDQTNAELHIKPPPPIFQLFAQVLLRFLALKTLFVNPLRIV